MSRESLSKISELTGMAPRTIKARLTRITPIQEGRALRYETKEVLPLLYHVGTDGEALDPQRERALLDRERRKALELANNKAERNLIPVAEVGETWSELVSIARGRLLALPARVAPTVLRQRDLRTIENTIRDAVIVILEELAGGAVDT